MKTLLYLTLICLLVIFELPTSAKIYTTNLQLKEESVEAIQEYLHHQFTELKQLDIQLNLIFQKEALATTHYTFASSYKGKEIYRGNIKVATNKKGLLLNVTTESNFCSVIRKNMLALSEIEWKENEVLPVLESIKIDLNHVKDYSLVWDLSDSIPDILLKLNSWDRSHDSTYFYKRDGTQKYYFNNARNAKKDTIINVQIFKPDPLTKLGLSYGGTYVDNNDAQQAWLASAYETAQTKAVYDDINEIFLLENQWVVIEDFESPNFAPATSLSSNFVFDRSQSGFEDCNAMYHITTFQEYIQSLGYDTLMDLQLRVETHGQFGADNSVFMRNGGNPTVSFGTGGIDDAEDADVIIHEYSHGISWSANNNDNFAIERSGLDEGIGDYFATSYSRAINSFNWQKVFNWDGPVWGGRVANTTSNYPSAGNIYAVGEIWNSAMSNIWNDLGAIVTDKLMLETLHFFTNTTTLPEAAQYMLKADSMLFGGIHYYSLCANFSLKGILPGGCAPTLTQDVNLSRKIRMVNTIGFAKNEVDLFIELPEVSSGELLIYASDGKMILKKNFKDALSIIVERNKLPSGIYGIHIKTKDLKYTSKFVKF